MFRPLIVEKPLVTVKDAGSLWYRVGENHDGPKSAHPRDLLIGREIPPIITASWADNEFIPYALYEDAQASAEPVYGLKDVFDTNGHLGQKPEAMVDLLVKALARWAALHRPDLNLEEV